MFKKILKSVQTEKSKSSISENTNIQDIPNTINIEQNQNKVLMKQKLNFDELEKYKINSDNDIDGIYYIPNILNEQEAHWIMDQVYNESQWNCKIFLIIFLQMQYAKRRVAKFGGDVTPQGLQNIQELPYFLQQLSNYCLLDNNKLNINHGLINEYQIGVGIEQHKDGPLYHGFVNIISLNSSCCFIFTKEDKKIKLFIEPNSLLIFSKSAYTNWLHGLEFLTEDLILVNEDENGQIIDADILNKNRIDFTKLKPNEIEIIKGNPYYNRAYVYKRNIRISITLRHVPINENN